MTDCLRYRRRTYATEFAKLADKPFEEDLRARVENAPDLSAGHHVPESIFCNAALVQGSANRASTSLRAVSTALETPPALLRQDGHSVRATQAIGLLATFVP